MTKYLDINEDLCTGCRICESTCSITNEGVINRAKSRVHVYRRDILKLEQLYCNQCEHHVCLSACPVSAIVIKNNQIRVDRKLCDGCGKCAQVCNKIFLAPDTNYALMCNQCAACVKTCPENAMTIKERECLE
jgi:anaerobic carbon-monoxide dehydrogenase iron sulfur subunit